MYTTYYIYVGYAHMFYTQSIHIFIVCKIYIYIFGERMRTKPTYMYNMITYYIYIHVYHLFWFRTLSTTLEISS